MTASYVQLVTACQLNMSNTAMPIPVWPLTSFSELAATLSHSFKAFLEVQALYNDSQIGLGSDSDRTIG